MDSEIENNALADGELSQVTGGTTVIIGANPEDVPGAGTVYQCQYCSQKFYDKGAYERHLHLKHFNQL